MGIHNLREQITNMQKLLVASLLLAVVAIVYAQDFPGRCGIFNECICRSGCDESIEYEGLIGANQRCSILNICSCRGGCETDEYQSEIDFCPGDAGLNCCCRDDPPEE